MGHIKIWSVFEATLHGPVVRLSGWTGVGGGKVGRKEVDPAKRETIISYLRLQPSHITFPYGLGFPQL